MVGGNRQTAFSMAYPFRAGSPNTAALAQPVGTSRDRYVSAQDLQESKVVHRHDVQIEWYRGIFFVSMLDALRLFLFSEKERYTL